MNTYLKAALSAVALAAVVAVPAVAKSRSQQHTAPGSTDIYQSDSLGHQSYPNPDRGPYPAPRGPAYY
jgi:acid phosphatase class B